MMKVIWDGDKIEVVGQAETQEEWDAVVAEIETKVAANQLDDPLALVCEAIKGLLTDAPYPCNPRGCREQRGRSEYGPIWWIIMHLNDEHGVSREAIADWLESLDIDLSFKLVD